MSRQTVLNNGLPLLNPEDSHLPARHARPAQDTGEPAKKVKATQASMLIALTETCSFFHSPDGVAYADMIITGARQTWRVRSVGFRRWLAKIYYDRTQAAPSSEALHAALGVMEAKALFESTERTVHLRVARHDDKLYLDLVDDQWRAVEVDASGWRIVTNLPVRFRRAPGMLALPEPQSGGAIDMLRPYLNIATEADFVLAVSWLLAAFRDCGPYPVLALSGEQGSAKSTFCSVMRRLVDPNKAPLRALSREDRDLFIAANNGHVLAFDNLSGLPDWISDTLCRLATGGGFAVRQLYADDDEVLFSATRPIILNGIEEVIGRSDLADRAVFLSLEPIAETKRKAEKEFWSAFERDRAHILGALLDGVAHGVAHLPNVTMERLPRMADFAHWAVACETCYWPPDTFLKAYEGNRTNMIGDQLDADPVAAAIRKHMESTDEWEGTASELLAETNKTLTEAQQKAATWPKTPRSLSGRIRRAATLLRAIGIDVGFVRDGRARRIEIKKPDKEGKSPSPPSPPSQSLENKDFDGDGRNRPAPADRHNRHSTVTPKCLNFRMSDANDGDDNELPTPSADCASSSRRSLS